MADPGPAGLGRPAAGRHRARRLRLRLPGLADRRRHRCDRDPRPGAPPDRHRHRPGRRPEGRALRDPAPDRGDARAGGPDRRDGDGGHDPAGGAARGRRLPRPHPGGGAHCDQLLPLLPPRSARLPRGHRRHRPRHDARRLRGGLVAHPARGHRPAGGVPRAQRAPAPAPVPAAAAGGPGRARSGPSRASGLGGLRHGYRMPARGFILPDHAGAAVGRTAPDLLERPPGPARRPQRGPGHQPGAAGAAPAGGLPGGGRPRRRRLRRHALRSRHHGGGRHHHSRPGRSTPRRDRPTRPRSGPRPAG